MDFVIGIEELRNNFEAVAERYERNHKHSVWSKAVIDDAEDMLDALGSAINDGCLEFPANTKLLDDALLNGAKDWNQYSWGGCALCYDGDIAERYCNPSELKRTRGGDLRPNAREEWLDVQARALSQASRLIRFAFNRA